MTEDKTGRIVWHDLFTDDAHVSRSFYGDVAGWHYVVEHAKDFAWGGGERDFILALSGDEAGAGFVALEDAPPYGWIPYVEVGNVDAIAARAEDLKGAVEKAPFEVPGVGRNCLLRDPNSALFGICLSRHAFPAPTRQFGPERYRAQPGAFPAAFYGSLFDWDILPADDTGRGRQSIMRAGTEVAVLTEDAVQPHGRPSWAPAIRVQNMPDTLHRVRALKGTVTDPHGEAPQEGASVLVGDPNGTPAYLITQ